MIGFDGKIVQFGFGAVGKSFYEKVAGEIRYDEKKYFVITKDPDEFEAYIFLNGLASNFIISEITKDNYRAEFEKYLSGGDLLIDFADTVGTRDICEWCAKKNIMYINTGDADWPENWPNVLEHNKALMRIQEEYQNSSVINKVPIVLQHGNNPGLVSHFVKAGIEYIANNQFKRDKQLITLIRQGLFNEAANYLKIRMIHVNDIDLQEFHFKYDDNTLINTWCIDSFLYEILTEASLNIGTHEDAVFDDACKPPDPVSGFLEFEKLAAEKKCRTYYPGGVFEGYLVPHDETVTIAKNLEVIRDGKLIYRPSVMFVYAPCRFASSYLSSAKVNEYPNPDPSKPPDCENDSERSIVRGYVYPENAEIVHKDDIESGTEYVGVLLIGENFKPVWVGNRLELSFLNKSSRRSYWQTPTITPVSMSALAAVCWMIGNKDKGGIYFPDDISDHKDILKTAEKYISKTIYKTFETDTLAKALNIDYSNIRANDFFV